MFTKRLTVRAPATVTVDVTDMLPEGQTCSFEVRTESRRAGVVGTLGVDLETHDARTLEQVEIPDWSCPMSVLLMSEPRGADEKRSLRVRLASRTPMVVRLRASARRFPALERKP